MKTKKFTKPVLILILLSGAWRANAQWTVTDPITHINQVLEHTETIAKWKQQIDLATKTVQTANNILSEARTLNEIKGDPKTLSWQVFDLMGESGQLDTLVENRLSLETLASQVQGVQAFTDSSLGLASASMQTMNLAGHPVPRNSALYTDIAQIAAANRELDAAQRVRTTVQASENALEQDLLTKLANAPTENEKKMYTEQLLALRERRKEMDDEIQARALIRDQLFQSQEIQKKMDDTMTGEALLKQYEIGQSNLLATPAWAKPAAELFEPGTYKGAADYIQ